MNLIMRDTRVIEPIKLTLNSKFKFRCYKGIKCFTKCCRRTDILLTPYDILRMKKRLGVSSEEFLENYTYTIYDERSSHPYAMLKMMDKEEKNCPFVTPEGCNIYTDRPLNCRFYPIGQGIMKMGSGGGPLCEEFYFFIRDPNCIGYQENKEWTIETWRIDQGINLYDDMNREWKDIQLRRDVHGHSLDSKKRAMFYIASYNLDKFNRYVFESRLLDLFDINGEEVEKIKTDEFALMKFGFKYLKYILMLEETLKLKKDIKPDVKAPNP